MKRLSTIIMALALVLGMSQCKKQETPTNGDSGEKVHITLNVSNGESLAVNVNDNGSRHDMSPRLGMVKFENGDVLHVGYNGHYFGQLTYQNGAFGGDLDAPAQNVEDCLYFYFLGGKGKGSEGPSANATSFTFSIADQHDVLPVLCYGHSNEPYTGNGSNYTATLEYKCALVRFNLKYNVFDDVTLSNVLTEATINFGNNTITPTTTKGDITLYGEDGVATHRWGILLPGTDLSHTTHPDLQWLGSGNMPTVGNNTYVNAGVNEGFQLHNPPYPAPLYTYAVHNSENKLSVFSVGDGKKVYFSRANLKYKPSTTKWAFHDNQYNDCFPNGTSNPSQMGSNVPMSSNNTEMDRFCWGLHGNPTLTGYDFLRGGTDLNKYVGTDWGCVFTAESDEGSNWRTLTADEWNYLLNSRSGNRYAFVSFKMMLPNHPDQNSSSYFGYIGGLLIAPDNFEAPTGFPSDMIWNTNNFNANSYNNYKGATVTTILNSGCVFLPGLGYRYHNYYMNYNPYNSAPSTALFGCQGYYWTATAMEQIANVSSTETSKMLYINKDDGITISHVFGEDFAATRDLGMCVRLVWDAN